MAKNERPTIVKTIANDDPRWTAVTRIRQDDGSTIVSWQLYDADTDTTHNRLETVRPKRRASEDIGVWNHFDDA